jgi:hypothetical protein
LPLINIAWKLAAKIATMMKAAQILLKAIDEN